MHIVGQDAAHHFTAGDANPQGEPQAVLTFEPVVEQGQRALHVEGGSHRALGVVLVRDRRPKNRHDGITHVLLDGSFVALNGAHQRGEEGTEDAPKVFWIKPFPERGRPRKIGKEHRDQPAVFAHGGLG